MEGTPNYSHDYPTPKSDSYPYHFPISDTQEYPAPKLDAGGPAFLQLVQHGLHPSTNICNPVPGQRCSWGGMLKRCGGERMQFSIITGFGASRGLTDLKEAEDHDSAELPDVVDEDTFLPVPQPFKLKQYQPPPKKIYWKRIKHIMIAEKDVEPPPSAGPGYMDILAPMSEYPPKKYCDLTGYEAKYVDPKTDMRYASADQFTAIRALPKDRVEACLAVRNAEHVLR